MATDENSNALPIPWNGPAEFPPRLRGIRHLKRVSVAKLRVGSEKQLYDTFFTLHEDLEAAELSKPFYSSEVVYDSIHPQWCVFHESQYVDPPDPSQKKLLVCVWEVGDSGLPRRLLLKVRIDLSELCFVSTMSLDFSDCTILFELQDGIYTTRSVRTKLEERGLIVSRDAYADEENSKRYSCSRSAYIDIIAKKRELKVKKERIAQLTSQIQQKKDENAAYYRKLDERNELEGRLSALKSQYGLLLITYQKKKQELEAKASVLIPTAEKLKAAQLALATSIQEMEQRRIELMAHHQQLTKTFFLIRKHQERLIKDLANVYRILPVRDANGNETRSYSSSSAHHSSSHPPSVVYMINGCTLNNSHFHGQDEEKIATGLGYVCHLVQLLSKYLDIPLRYPMQPMMSRSTIQDVVGTSDRFPLYSKAQNIEQFRFAVALLNRNVEQLVLSQRLEPFGLRETLPNLRHLLDHFIVPQQQAAPSTQLQQLQQAQMHVQQQQQLVDQSSFQQATFPAAPPPTTESESESPRTTAESEQYMVGDIDIALNPAISKVKRTISVSAPPSSTAPTVAKDDAAVASNDAEVDHNDAEVEIAPETAANAE